MSYTPPNQAPSIHHKSKQHQPPPPPSSHSYLQSSSVRPSDHGKPHENMFIPSTCSHQFQRPPQSLLGTLCFTLWKPQGPLGRYQPSPFGSTGRWYYNTHTSPTQRALHPSVTNWPQTYMRTSDRPWNIGYMTPHDALTSPRPSLTMAWQRWSIMYSYQWGITVPSQTVPEHQGASLVQDA